MRIKHLFTEFGVANYPAYLLVLGRGKELSPRRCWQARNVWRFHQSGHQLTIDVSNVAPDTNATVIAIETK